MQVTIMTMKSFGDLFDDFDIETTQSDDGDSRLDPVDALGVNERFSDHTAATASDLAQQKFTEFDNRNPEIWQMFCEFSFQLINLGFQRYSADAILHRVRWETAVRGVRDQYKINNNYSAFYARKFRETHPRYAAFFEMRRSKADGLNQVIEAPAPSM